MRDHYVLRTLEHVLTGNVLRAQITPPYEADHLKDVIYQVCTMEILRLTGSLRTNASTHVIVELQSSILAAPKHQSMHNKCIVAAQSADSTVELL